MSEINIKNLANKVIKGERRSLAKAITLVESDLPEHQALVDQLLSIIHSSTGKSIRLGISGAPGAGKSTFIETLGLELIKKGHKVAVLAIDPSSPKSGGSILGDKTRMEILSQNENAFIRPSPTKESIGGVTRSTREAILLCEAAGYDMIIIETVGVGQSEYQVASMVDFFYLIMLPNAGDELQGIKKGIIELADSIIVNKADEKNVVQANLAKTQYENALHIIQRDNFWQPNVLCCSSTEKTGFDEVINNLFEYIKKSKISNHFLLNRQNQTKLWFKQLIDNNLINLLMKNKYFSKTYVSLENDVIAGKRNAYMANKELITIIKKKLEE